MTSAKKSIGTWILRLTASLFAVAVPTTAHANTFPPVWGTGVVNEATGPIHFAPAAWPAEPASPTDCGVSCGSWKPYSRFQNDINDPRVQDPSNGGTAPQNYVNIASSCVDKSYPSIYYYLYKDPGDPTKDVLMFRWRVEQIAHNYATGPSAGNYGATDPWSSGLWTVLFDVDGDGYRDIAAHLNGSSGDPSHPIDMIAGIWGNIPTQSIDYLTDPNIKLIAHNPTGFTSTSGSTLLNFQGALNPTTTWPAGSSSTSWDYGTSRAKLVYTNACTEYFVDYQIPIRMLDASSSGPNVALNGPKITRDTPISMLFCTANSLNNPFQKDCALNRSYLGDAAKPAPFGDYLSFNKETPYTQPIISSVTAAAPSSCASPSYQLTAKVQDTLYVDSSGTIKPSIKEVKFFYWYDKDGDGTTAGDSGSSWIQAAAGNLKSGTLNTWLASWNSSGLLKGRYLIGAQAVDDKTLHDDGVPDAPIDNRTFSYIVGSTVAATQAQIYNNAWSWNGTTKAWVQGAPIGWATGQQALFPAHAVAMTPAASEDWYGNPDVTGLQVAQTGVDLAVNACGVAPTITKTASPGTVTVGQEVTFGITVGNPVNNPAAISLTQLQDVLPAGFSYKAGSTTGVFGTSDPSTSGQTLTWTGATSINPGASASLSFIAFASSVTGTYSNTASATTDFGGIASDPVQIGVGAPRLTVSKVPSAYSTTPGSALTYTITYANDSPINATGVTLSDILPAGLSYVAASCSGGCTYTSGTQTLAWTIGNLASGEGPYSVSFQATVDSPYTGAATNQNTVSIASAQTAPATATASVYIDTPRPQLTLKKSASATVVAPGANITFTLAYANTGNATANAVVLSDPLPSGFTYVSATGSPGSTPGVGANGTVTWNFATLAAGASGTVTVTAQATNAFTGSANPATNTASIAATEVTTPVTDSATVGVSESGQVCRTYYMSSQQGNVGVDGNQYLATTTTPSGGITTISKLADDNANAGIIEIARFYQDPISGQLVTFDGSSTLAGQLDYIKSTSLGGAANSNSTLYVTVYDYDPATGTTVQIAQKVLTDNGAPSPPVILTGVTASNQLSKGHRLLIVMGVDMAASKITTIELRANSANSYVQLCAPAPANLVLEKTVNSSSLSATGTGRTLTYTLNYANTSAATGATNAALVDTLPSGVTFSSATLDGNPITPTGANPYTFALGTVAASGTGTLVITANVANDLSGTSSLINTADIASDQTAAVTATASTTVTGATSNPAGTPNVLVSKQASATLLAPGNTVTYTLTAVNAGDKTATSVVVTDDFPNQTYFAYGTCTTATGSCSESPAGTLSWPVGSLTPGQTATLTFTMVVGTGGTAPPSGVTTLDNSASVTYAGGGTGSASSNTVTVSISTNPNLALSKSVLPVGTRSPGDTLTYTLTVSNSGSGSASSVVVSDPIPANTSFQGTITATAGTGTFDAVNNRVVFNVGTLAAGATATLSFKTEVNSPFSAGSTTVTNAATASAANASSRSASATSTVTASPTMTLNKTGPSSVPFPATTLSAAASNSTVLFVASAAPFSVGQYVKVGATITPITAMTGSSLTVADPITAASGTQVFVSATLLLSYRNSGNADAASVVVSDPLPAGWVFVAASPAQTSAPAVGANGTVSWNIGTVAAGSGGTLQLIVIPTAAGTTTNTATLTDSVYCTGGTPPASCSDGLSINTGGLSVSKSTSTPNVGAGGTAAWTLTVTNTLSTAVTGIDVSDILPSGFSYAATGTISAPGATRTAIVNPTIGDTQPKWGSWTLPANSTLSIPFTANVAANVGPATYQNDITLVSTTAAAGIIPFDPLATTAEDVTVLASGTGIVNGVAYRDNNGNGSYDAAIDTPLPGVAVTLIDDTSTTYVIYTDASGFFSRVVSAGSTIVDVDNGSLPSGLVLTSGGDGVDPSTVTVPDGGVVSRNTGFVAASGTVGNVTGNVWLDSNANGVKGAGENNRLGVQIILRDATTNAVVATAYTDITGNYSFPNVPTGNYKVNIVPPAGFMLTTANDLAPVTVTNAGTVTVNFGLLAGSVMSGTVFRDNGTGGGTAADGLQNGTEPGTSAGALNVVIIDAANVVVSVASVAANGTWSVTVPTGTYSAYLTTASPAIGATMAAAVTLPATWSVTGENKSGVVDGSANGILTGINAAANVSGLNFGINSAVTGYTVSGVVFNDANGNGLVNGESGTNAGGVNAVLVDGSGNIVAITGVAANGTWSFSSVADGSYVVRLSTGTGTAGNPAPAAALPMGWFNTGESANGTTTDGTADGNLAITVSGANLTTPALGIRQRADVIVQKNGPALLAASGSVNYTVRVSNAGPGSADGTVFTDSVPAGVTAMTWVCGNALGDALCPNASGSGSISETIATLPAGGSVTYTITATAPNTSFSNTATATVPTTLYDPDTANNSSSVSTLIGTPTATADLAVIKYGPASVTANGSLLYTVVVSNAGPAAAHGATFSDPLAAGFGSVTWTCGNATGGALCPAVSGNGAISQTIANFPAGASLSYVISGTAPAGGSVTNTTTIAPPAGVTDPEASNNSSTATTTVAATTASADLAAIKTGPASVAGGGVLAYTLVVSNTGPDAVLNARVRDVIPPALTAVTWICGGATGGGTCDTANGNGNTLDTTVDLPAGATVTITVSGTAPSSPTTFINTAQVIPPSGTADPDLGNNISGPVITSLGAVPDIFTQVNAPAQVTAGGVVNALVSFGNQGSTAAAGVAYQITLPAGLSAVSCAGAGCSYNSATGVITVSGLPTSLSPGQALQFTLAYRAPSGAGVAVPIQSTITTTTSGETPTANNTATATTTTTGSAVLADPTTWISAPTNAYSGQTVTVTAGFTNLGSANATGVTYALNGLPASASVSYNGVTCTWNSGSGAVSGCGLPSTIPIGQSLSLQASYTAPASGPVTVTSSIAATSDSNAANNTATASTAIAAAPVTPLADVAASVAAPGTANRGSTVLVPISFSNLGPALANGVAYSVTLGGSSTNARITYNGVQCSYSGGTITGCGLPGILNPGQTISLVLSFTAPGTSGSVPVVASITTTSTETTTANNVASGFVTIPSTTPSGTISGRVWYDTNHNSRLDAGEAGRAGWTVELTQGGAVIAQTISSSTGAYSFSGLGDGVYSVRFNSRTGAGAVPVNGEAGASVPGGGVPGQSIISNIVIGGGVTTVPEQSLPIDPSGTVYNSVTRQPIAGATVTLGYSCAAMDPAWVVGGNTTIITAADGNYAFFLQPAAPSACNYTLSISRAGYTFASTSIPPTAGLWPAGGGSVSGVAGAPALAQNTTYYLTGPKPTADLIDNNIPLDPAAGAPGGAVSIPTLSECGVILLSALMAAFGLGQVRRRDSGTQC